MAEEEKLLEMTGSIERVVFQNDKNGYAILEINNGEELVTAVGTIPGAAPGEELHLVGIWGEHPTFGRQFQVQAFERLRPHSSEAILQYLSSGAVKGIGPRIAQKLVEAFGENTLEVIEKEPDRLTSIQGITLNKAKKINEYFCQVTSIREVILYLSQYGITPQESVRAYQTFGAETPDIVRENPYRLCQEGISIGFHRVDEIAASMERPADDDCRIRAGLIFVLRHNLQNGHTYLPKDKLVPAAAGMLGVSIEQTDSVMEELLSDGTLDSCEIHSRVCCFLPDYYEAENYAAERLKMMLEFPSQPIQNVEEKIDCFESSTGLNYAPEQREAIRAAVTGGILVLTGGPGTGKTTTLHAIIHLLKQNGEKVFLAAPTGRAAKRMSQMTGEEAKTIHRLLQVEWGENDQPVFSCNEKNRLECDALIVDELSMLDAKLFEALLKALPMGCRLILVGDRNQLPSVGAGNVLGDLIDSGKLPVVALKHIFRQAMESLIITNAHAILEGKMPILNDHSRDFFFLPCSEPEKISKTVIDLVKRRLPESYGYSAMTDLQVLSMARKGDLGTIELNRRLQAVLNPADRTKSEIRVGPFLFREGDKVMQIKNNYHIAWEEQDGSQGEGVFNGDMGILQKIDRRASILQVEMDGRLITYELGMAKELELAYAMTIHKSQGSEFDAVVMPVYPGPPQLLYRNLLYTAITRAKNLLILVGTQQTIRTMVENDKKMKRFSGLCAFLTGEENHEPDSD